MERNSLFVTASNVGEIVHFTERRDEVVYAKSLVNPKSFSTPATRWGQMHEKDAIAKFEEMSHIKVKPCGHFKGISFHWGNT